MQYIVTVELSDGQRIPVQVFADSPQKAEDLVVNTSKGERLISITPTTS